MLNSRARWPKSRDFGSAVAGGEPWLFKIFGLLFHRLEKVKARPAGGQKNNMNYIVSHMMRSWSG